MAGKMPSAFRISRLFRRNRNCAWLGQARRQRGVEFYDFNANPNFRLVLLFRLDARPPQSQTTQLSRKGFYLISFIGSSDPKSRPDGSTARTTTESKASRNSGYFATSALITA